MRVTDILFLYWRNSIEFFRVVSTGTLFWKFYVADFHTGKFMICKTWVKK